MIIKKIKLENIRSYETCEIEFPEDLILLSGNVGSGKSSILLAIDFALFGIRRGELSGSALLRNGTNRGKVNLTFEVDNSKIEIERTLKRSKDSVVQDSGYIIINGEKKEGTAVELKQIILKLLNYPPEMLTKRSLIYRYTVYTPQEEMKHILSGEKEFRVDALRKVFGIDKYKRIKESSLIFIRFLREEIREMKGRLINHNEKVKLLDKKKKNLEEIKLNLSRLINTINEHSEEVARVKNKIKHLEEDSLNLRELKHKLEMLEIKIKNESDKLRHNEIEIGEVKKQIIQLRLEVGKEVKVDDKQINKLKSEIEKYKKELKEVEDKIAEFKINYKNSESVKNLIKKMDMCPTCKRRVTLEDKLKISREEDSKISEFMSKIQFNQPFVLGLIKKIKESEEELDKLREIMFSSEAVKLKKKNLNEKIELQKKLEEEINIFKNAISNSEADKKLISVDVLKLKNIAEEYKEFKKRYEKLLERDKELSLINNSYEKDMSTLDEDIIDLKKELEENKKIKNKLEWNGKLMGWLNIHFVNLMNIIERKIMLKVHSDFDLLFKKWFEMLISDELLNVKLDEEFTPLIEQNGYMIDYEHLSGGEKTAAALAYRLALNQVINKLMSIIKTRDLLILDEPTDGFSDEQIERMKDVLLELENKQTIIVSHESKIESFVNTIIRLEKVGHVSSIRE